MDCGHFSNFSFPQPKGGHFRNFSFPQPKEASYLSKTGSAASEMSFEKVRRKVITIAHPEHSSGELKSPA